MHNRGSINNRDRAKQLRDFSGLQFGSITPTDIDGLIEYQNKAYVFFELKYGEAEMPTGQRLAFERTTDDLENKKPTLFLIATHNVSDCNKDIDTANASVTEYRLKGEWVTFSPEFRITTKKIIELFLENLEIGSTGLLYLCIKAHAQTNISQFMGGK